MHLYLIRHADPDYENDSLTTQGNAEAEALAKKLADRGVNHVYSSSSGRAVKTAGYIAGAVGAMVVEASWLMEPNHLSVKQKNKRYVIWDTFGETVRSPVDLPNQQTWQNYPPFDTPETLRMWDDFKGKSDSLMAKHGYAREENLYRIERSNRDRIAIVCHNGVVLMFLAHLLELPVSLVWAGFYIWPSSVTTVFFEEHSDRSAAPRALAVADTSHLYAAGLEPQPRGMGAGRYEPYV